MRVDRTLTPGRIATIAAVVALVTLSAAQAAQNDPLSKIKIKNFGCANENFYGGARPKKEDYRALKETGIKTIVDLQRGGERGEQSPVEAAGMRFFRIGMSDKARPSNDKVEEFLSIINDPENRPAFVYCRGGRHRTGAMTAIYRRRHDNWPPDKAYAEMKRFDFEYVIGHSPLREYVFDYFNNVIRKEAVTNARP